MTLLFNSTTLTHVISSQCNVVYWVSDVVYYVYNFFKYPGFCVLKASMDKCRSLPSINTLHTSNANWYFIDTSPWHPAWLTLDRRTLHWHLSWQSVKSSLLRRGLFRAFLSCCCCCWPWAWGEGKNAKISHREPRRRREG